MKYGFYLFLLVLFSSSCEGFFTATKEVDLGEFAGEVTVVARLINSDLDTFEDFTSIQNLGVLVSRSRSVLDTSRFSLISDAEVKLTGSDGLELDYVFDEQSGNYFPFDENLGFERLSVNENAIYELLVDVPGENKIIASSETKSFAEIESINIIQNDIEGDGNTMLDRIQIGINDPPEENYYLLKVFYKFKRERDGENRSYVRGGYLFNYSSIFDESPELFTDELFNGKSDVLEFWSERYIDSINSNGDPEIPDEVIVFVWSLSEEEYEFRKSLEANRNAEDNPFAEPSIVFSNIENGIGVFSISSVERHVIPWK